MSETATSTTRQAHEIEVVLWAVAQTSQSCDESCKDNIWPAVLKFLLDATDLLLSGQTCAGKLLMLIFAYAMTLASVLFTWLNRSVLLG